MGSDWVAAPLPHLIYTGSDNAIFQILLKFNELGCARVGTGDAICSAVPTGLGRRKCFGS